MNKIRSAQGKPISSTPLPQLSVYQPMKQSPPAIKKAPEIIYLDSSNSSQDTSKGIPEQQMPTHTEPRLEVYNSPHSSSVYKTPPSSPRNDSISDPNDEDIQELNKNFLVEGKCGTENAVSPCNQAPRSIIYKLLSQTLMLYN